MKVCDIAEKLSLKPLSVADSSREVTGVYIGDLLSWVMGRADCGDAWITIMSNINIVAVASLADVACIILAEGVCPTETSAPQPCKRESTSTPRKKLHISLPLHLRSACSEPILLRFSYSFLPFTVCRQ